MSERSSGPARPRRASVPRARAAGRLPTLAALLAAGSALAAAACAPKVQVEAPKEPITINLNIKLDADVRLKVEEAAKEDVRTKPIF